MAPLALLAVAATLVCGGDTFSAEDKPGFAARSGSLGAVASETRSRTAAFTAPDTGGVVNSGPGAAVRSSSDGPGSSSSGSAHTAVLWTNATAAFRFGYNAYKTGDTQGAVDALAYAAERGHPAALWKLGRMYQTGDGVERDDRRAFALFSRIADAHADSNPRGPDARFVASAFVTLGRFYVDGLAGMTASEATARRYFYHAALYYADPEAQFRLAAMYLTGRGGAKNVEMAARWFKLAAQKGHVGAQAELGRLLFDGVGGFARNPVKGLMWLSIANASGGDDPHIRLTHDQAFALADERQRRTAALLVREWGSLNP